MLSIGQFMIIKMAAIQPYLLDEIIVLEMDKSRH